MSNKNIPILVVEDISDSRGITNSKLSAILQNTSSTITSVSTDVLRENIAAVTHESLILKFKRKDNG